MGACAPRANAALEAEEAPLWRTQLPQYWGVEIGEPRARAPSLADSRLAQPAADAWAPETGPRISAISVFGDRAVDVNNRLNVEYMPMTYHIPNIIYIPNQSGGCLAPA